ncbi:MAG TPA: hypothetical protein VKP67_07425 [Xanthobacteraceae bacterium]|nr:hypothetical protein [Xanthobacteraceae bacterium]
MPFSSDKIIDDTIRDLLTEHNSSGERPIHESLIVEGLNSAFRPPGEPLSESIKEFLGAVVLDHNNLAPKTPDDTGKARPTFGSLLAAYRGGNPTADDRAKLGLALFVKVILSFSWASLEDSAFLKDLVAALSRRGLVLSGCEGFVKELVTHVLDVQKNFGLDAPVSISRADPDCLAQPRAVMVQGRRELDKAPSTGHTLYPNKAPDSNKAPVGSSPSPKKDWHQPLPQAAQSPPKPSTSEEKPRNSIPPPRLW